MCSGLVSSEINLIYISGLPLSYEIKHSKGELGDFLLQSQFTLKHHAFSRDTAVILDNELSGIQLCT